MNGWRRTVRTIFQMAVGLAAMAPVIYTAITNGSPELAAGYAATALAIAAAITRVMALPGVERFLQSWLPFLAAHGNPHTGDAAAPLTEDVVVVAGEDSAPLEEAEQVPASEPVEMAAPALESRGPLSFGQRVEDAPVDAGVPMDEEAPEAEGEAGDQGEADHGEEVTEDAEEAVG